MLMVYHEQLEVENDTLGNGNKFESVSETPNIGSQ